MTLEINVFTMKRYNSFVFIKLFFSLLSLFLIVRKAEDATERFNGEDTLTLHWFRHTQMIKKMDSYFIMSYRLELTVIFKH